MNWIKRVCFLTLFCAAATAGPITFTEIIANANGSLDGSAFASQTVTLVLTGDTSGIVNSGGGGYELLGAATVNVSGIGTDTFTDSMEAIEIQPINSAEIGDVTNNSILLRVTNVGLGSYALNTSIGPLSGGTVGSTGTSYATEGGSFEFTSALNVDHPASFTASTSSVPEPGTLGLISAGIALLLLQRRNSV